MSRHLAIVLIVCIAIPACRRAAPTNTTGNTGATGAYAGNPTVGGAIQATRGAVQRVATMNELENLRLFIDNASSASGRMPNKQQIMDAAKEDPRLREALDKGLIILTGTTKREAVWAYVADAPTNGGFVVSATGIERLDAAEVNRRLQSGN